MLPDGIRSVHPRSATKRSTVSNDHCDTDHKMASVSFGARLLRFSWSLYRNSRRNDRSPLFSARSAHARRGEDNLVRPDGLGVRRPPEGVTTPRCAPGNAREEQGPEAPTMISSAAGPPSHAEIDRDGTVTATRPARKLRCRGTLSGDGALSWEDDGQLPCRCVARPSFGARRDGLRARRSRVTCGTRCPPARRVPAGQ